ncbi:hypothetical protein G3578_20415 [Brevibacillus sp. SYP-B805]|uniref:hypothetical protein n=1 Tax=Brevibacillus sp. SYP-B805 TaxID=1578199 RepID=UPI0013EA9598|nr:hypothetical protein [Brevibacillus sp. SYP-B805]NGQ97505.1 hypothetical protein [Brevibacillus sp. SYP-B805]
MEDLKKAAEKIKDYWLLIPFIVYTIGFFYVQGLLGSLKKKPLFFDLSGVSASFEFYIKNGLKILYIFVISMAFALILFKYLKETTVVNKIKVYYWSLFSTLFFITVVIWLVVLGCILYNINNENLRYLLGYIDGVILIINIFYYCVLFTYFLIGLYIIEKSTNKKNGIGFIKNEKYNNKSKEFKISDNLFHLLLLVFSLIISLIYSGISDQTINVEKALNNKGGSLKFADIYSNNQFKRYLYIDIVNNYFYGYDLSFDNTTSVVIPLSKIDKLEIIELSAPIKVKTYKNGDSGAVKTIKTYYHSLITKDAASFINTLSWNIYSKFPYSLVPKDTLKELWNIKNTENIPINYQIFEAIDQEKSKGTTEYLYVVEYYKNDVKYLEFEMIKEKESYKINRISDVKQPFTITQN